MQLIHSTNQTDRRCTAGELPLGSHNFHSAPGCGTPGHPSPAQPTGQTRWCLGTQALQWGALRHSTSRQSAGHAPAEVGLGRGTPRVWCTWAGLALPAQGAPRAVGGHTGRGTGGTSTQHWACAWVAHTGRGTPQVGPTLGHPPGWGVTGQARPTPATGPRRGWPGPQDWLCGAHTHSTRQAAGGHPPAGRALGSHTLWVGTRVRGP